MANPKDVDVTVLVTSDPSKPEGVAFELQSTLGSSNKLTFKNSNHPGFKVNFKISDPDNTGCRFQPKPEDAMWVQTFPSSAPPVCPVTPLYWDQFEATDVKNQETRLIVVNKNSYPQMFAFSLRFTKPGSPDAILYDPIGDNRNGDMEVASMSLGTGLLIAGAVVAVAAFLFLAE
jgi:hypothetical protein